MALAVAGNGVSAADGRHQGFISAESPTGSAHARSAPLSDTYLQVGIDDYAMGSGAASSVTSGSRIPGTVSPRQ
jgi:hypothetical protein